MHMIYYFDFVLKKSKNEGMIIAIVALHGF